MGPGDWRATILGKQAIGHVRRVLVEYLNDLESGHVDLVRESLRRRPWSTEYNWTGVPPVILDRLDGACDDAAGLLHGDDPDVAGAQEAIEKALDYWLDQRPGPDPPGNWAPP